MTSTTSISKQVPHQVFALRDHSVAIIEGPDAATFLQGQCTNDVNTLDIGHAQLSAHCNHKGRIISSFILSRHSEECFFLRFRKNLADTAIAAMQKYLVFSKAKLRLSELKAYVVVKGSAALPDTSALANLQCYTQGESQLEIYTPTNAEHDLAQVFDSASVAGPEQWNLQLVHQGLFEIDGDTSEQFLPQELNYDCLAAVNFKKGCYTGQEVIARLHYRGEAKQRLRRAYIGQAEALVAGPLVAGKSTVIDRLTTKTCGTVLLAPESGTQGREFLALVKNASLANDCVLDTNTTAKIEWLPLPYAIP